MARLLRRLGSVVVRGLHRAFNGQAHAGLDAFKKRKPRRVKSSSSWTASQDWKALRAACRNRPLWFGLRRRTSHCFYGSEREVGLLAVVFLKDVEPRFFFQLEFVRLLGFARANQALPFRCTHNVFDICSITVSQAEVLYQVLHVAVWALRRDESSTWFPPSIQKCLIRTI